MATIDLNMAWRYVYIYMTGDGYLGLLQVVVGTYADVFPPARGTWYSALVGFICVGIGLLFLLLSRLTLTRSLGAALVCVHTMPAHRIPSHLIQPISFTTPPPPTHPTPP